MNARLGSRHSNASVGWCGLLWLLSCGGDDVQTGEVICSASDLTERLASAASGDTVELGACRISGTFVLGAGVKLRGRGPESVLVVPAGGIGLTVSLGDSPTEVNTLSIESAGRAALLVRGPGRLSLRSLELKTTRGLGVALEGVDQVTAEEVQIVGDIDRQAADNLPIGILPEDAATHGLVLLRVGEAILNRVDVRGQASYGVLSVATGLRWMGGGITDTLGVGLFVHGGRTDLSQIEVCRIFGGTRLEPAYGVAFAGAAVVESTGLSVCDSDGFGAVHSETSSVKHLEFSGRGNQSSAVWVQNASSFELSGALANNGRAGMVAVAASNLTLHDLSASDTRAGTTLRNGQTIRIGDGLQLVGSTQGSTLNRVSLSGNQRVGLLLELEGDALSADVLKQLTVTSSATDQLGVIAQGGPLTSGWDSNVMREGTTAANDALFAGTLDTVGATGPCFMPAQDLTTGGLAALLGP